MPTTEIAQLSAMLTGLALAVNLYVVGSTCVGRSSRAMTIVRAALPAFDAALLALAFASPCPPWVKAFSAVCFSFGLFALSLQLTAPRDNRLHEPAWWGSFEAAFWRYIERDLGALGD